MPHASGLLAKAEPPREPTPPPAAPPPPPEKAPPVVIVEKQPDKPQAVVVKAVPPPPVVIAKGEIVFIIRPWAEVHVNGKKLGVTPLSGPVQLEAGEHEVRLVNPDLGKDITRTVTVSANAREVVKEIFE